MEEEIIRELIDAKNFYKVMDEYNLYKYQLLKLMRDVIFANNSSIYDKGKEILREIYQDKGCIFNIKYDPVVFISDIHFNDFSNDCNDINKLIRFRSVLEFCKNNRIKYLINGGDIMDGTLMCNGQIQPINGNNYPLEKEIAIARSQVDNLLDMYSTCPEVTQLLLGGNHDFRYLERSIDILRELADKKNVNPLGYWQSFFSVFGCPISLEHDEPLSPGKSSDLIPHNIKICGHSHVASFENNRIKIPTLSGFLYHKGEKGGEPGFLVMYPYNERDLVKLEFEHFYLRDNNFVREANPYVYKLKK